MTGVSRMCRALMPGDEESMTDEAIWETLPVKFWNAIFVVYGSSHICNVILVSDVYLIQLILLGILVGCRIWNFHFFDECLVCLCAAFLGCSVDGLLHCCIYIHSP